MTEIRNKIAEKISEIIGRKIHKEDFALWYGGDYINNNNFRRLLENGEGVSQQITLLKKNYLKNIIKY